jgi:hypothetical protein
MQNLKAPTQCVLWERPDLIDAPLREHFELVEEYEHESHFWRYLLKCHECGQLYFFQFYEEIDWVDGRDPHDVVFIPVETSEQVEALKATSVVGVLRFSPRLHRTYAKDAEKIETYWIGKHPRELDVPGFGGTV